MPRRAQRALTGALGGVVALLILWYGAHDVAALRAVDAHVLAGFESFRRPWLDRLAYAVASLCDPVPYVLLAAVPVAVGIARHHRAGWRLSLVIVLVLLGANETTELLKPLLAGAHDPVAGGTPSDVSYPSGHATASMSLALTMVLAAAPRRRALVGTAMAAFVVAVCFSFLEQGWHYPSDVLGGFLVAGIWTLLGVAGLAVYEEHRPALVRRMSTGSWAPGPGSSVAEALAPPLAALLLGLTAVGLLALARPHAALAFARGHEFFVLGAATIAVLAFGLPSALGLALRRPPDQLR